MVLHTALGVGGVFAGLAFPVFHAQPGSIQRSETIQEIIGNLIPPGHNNRLSRLRVSRSSTAVPLIVVAAAGNDLCASLGDSYHSPTMEALSEPGIINRVLHQLLCRQIQPLLGLVSGVSGVNHSLDGIDGVDIRPEGPDIFGVENQHLVGHQSRAGIGRQHAAIATDGAPDLGHGFPDFLQFLFRCHRSALLRNQSVQDSLQCCCINFSALLSTGVVLVLLPVAIIAEPED